MVLSKEDRVLIEQLHRFNGYGAKKLVKEFPEKKWQVCSVETFTEKAPGNWYNQPSSRHWKTTKCEDTREY